MTEKRNIDRDQVSRLQPDRKILDRRPLQDRHLDRQVTGTDRGRLGYETR